MACGGSTPLSAGQPGRPGTGEPRLAGESGALAPEGLKAEARAHFAGFAQRFRRRVYFGIDQLQPATPAATVIHMDQHEAARLVTEHLLQLGHRRIAVVVGASLDESSPVAQTARYARALLQAAGAEFVPFALGRSEPELVALVRTQGVTAYWGINDFVMLLQLHYCRGAGLRIPQELSLVGRHDTPHSWGTLSSVSLNPEGVAAAVVAALQLAPEAAGNGGQVLVAPRLVVRESSGPAPTISGPATPLAGGGLRRSGRGQRRGRAT